jgi:C1A family cysteine protease
MDSAFQYLEANLIELESSYSYRGVDGSCQYSASKGVSKVSSFVDVAVNNPSALASAVAQSPVSIAIEADQSVFGSYTGGIISSGCGTNLDHGVLLVGYGTSGSQDYWIVKNSWGTGWGESGYVRIAKDNTAGPGVCGLQQAASYPKI